MFIQEQRIKKEFYKGFLEEKNRMRKNKINILILVKTFLRHKKKAGFLAKLMNTAENSFFERNK